MTNPLNFGLPAAESLKKYRIWDSYFTPSHSHPGSDGSQRLIADIERTLATIEKARIEKLCYFAHVGTGTTADAELERTLRARPEIVQKSRVHRTFCAPRCAPLQVCRANAWIWDAGTWISRSAVPKLPTPLHSASLLARFDGAQTDSS